MYAAVPCYNLGRLHRLIKHDLPPCPHGLAATWLEIAAIQKRQADRGGFLDHLEAKYKAQEKPSKKGKKGKKRTSEDEEDDEGGMPSEEAFQAAAARLKSAGSAESGRKTKRTKH